MSVIKTEIKKKSYNYFNIFEKFNPKTVNPI